MSETKIYRTALASRVRLLVRGVVQGVGFRPYVYRLARQHGLAGFVMNSAVGVVIEIEGEGEEIAAFLMELPVKGPPLMEISGFDRDEIALQSDTEFLIRESVAGTDAFTLVPPDIRVCDECLAEVRDPANRRFGYAFTNCTNCGPRYSIILDVPYDRGATTMAGFTQCEQCRREYEDPGNRRFHAQPNACAVCGPRMQLAVGEAPEARTGSQSPLEAAADVLEAGGIVAWKGLGGYQLVCDARQQTAVERLRQRKRRNEKPFAVMMAGIEAVEAICIVSEAERAVLLSRERPIVLLERRAGPGLHGPVLQKPGIQGAGLAEAVAPDNPHVGMMLPCTPMQDLLFRILRKRGSAEAVLVMTSGNVSEEPIVIDNSEAERHLAGIADVFVHHDRGIHTRVDDSVVRVMDGLPMVLRRARGYSPAPLWLGLGNTEVLACGSQQKNTLCLTKAGFALPSQHLGDLENYETLEFFEETLKRMQRLFHVNPRVVAHDLHPGYLSTQLAKKMAAERLVGRLIGVQHHHAHIASCMAEHQLRGKVIGVAWDGTGFGTDGTIWGGEFLVANLAGFERAAHFRPVLLAGGDAAVREPWRVARGYLYDAFDSMIPSGVGCSQQVFGTQEISDVKMRLLDAMLEKRIHTIATSSCGRLFDAVAALVGLRQTVSFEGQAAMALEAIADTGMEARYEFALDEGHPMQVDFRVMLRQIVVDIQRGEPASRVAGRFHSTLIAAAVEVCRRIRGRQNLSRVCLSGGCFQNVKLLRGSVAALRVEGFEVFFQRRIPCNDGGISVGQAAIACELVERGA